ncbi:MAG: hypothetical protein QM608_18530 [Caulobacter sp.]
MGPALDRWPADEAETAIDLLSASEEAQDLFAKMTAEDLGVFDDPGGDLSPLADRIGKAL